MSAHQQPVTPLHVQVERIRGYHRKGMLQPRGGYREALERIDPLAWRLARHADRHEALTRVGR